MFGKKTTKGAPVQFHHEETKKKEVEFSSVEIKTTTEKGEKTSVREVLPTSKYGVPLAIYTDKKLETAEYKKTRQQIIEILLEHVDFDALEALSKDVQKDKIIETTNEILAEIEVPLNQAQHDALKGVVIDELLGFGPLEPLLADKEVADIMINGPYMVYIERKGKIEISDVKFNNDAHLINIIQKICTRVGRTVDESRPMVDARLPDGSRFNAIIAPLALDGGLVSIRKFKQDKMELEDYLTYESMTEDMMKLLTICGEIRLNILISGGTGSGKTTMLNALSGKIDMGERVITIEDAAELQLKQPHVLRLETRPTNSEGHGEITQRDLVKNALRMRPDRIILGEIRGEEIMDVLAAMNTGHDGSMSTIHSNSPTDCLARVENLIALAGVTIPLNAMRKQISGALNLIVQVSRMRDGGRRVTHIEEVIGMDGDEILTQNLVRYEAGPMGDDGKLKGEFVFSGIKPQFYDQAISFNKAEELDKILEKYKKKKK